ncbi:MAG: hypothetical protein WBL61_09235, partial [Bryobacteraceae bacterium]
MLSDKCHYSRLDPVIRLGLLLGLGLLMKVSFPVYVAAPAAIQAICAIRGCLSWQEGEDRRAVRRHLTRWRAHGRCLEPAMALSLYTKRYASLFTSSIPRRRARATAWNVLPSDRGDPPPFSDRVSIFQSKDDPEIGFRFQYKVILKSEGATA